MNGAIFEAIIEPCQNLQPPVNFPDQTHYCISSPTEIGFPGYEGTFVQMQWSPGTYLDDPNSATPVFTPPGTNGSITYDVFYSTGAFPGYGFTQVTVHYSDGLNTPPSVSYSNLVFDNYDLSVDLNINSSVDVITMSFGGSSFNLYRGIDFDAPIYHLDLNHLFVSCCENTTIEFIAKSYCGGSDTTSFVWTKSGPDLGFESFNTYVMYPGSDDPEEPNSLCMTTNMACSYDLKIVNRYGDTIYTSYGVPILGNTTCIWYGQVSDGADVLDGNYWALVTLHNDCGQEDQVYQPFAVYTPTKSALYTNPAEETSTFHELKPETEPNILISTFNSTLLIKGEVAESQHLILTNYLGQIICQTKFTGSYSRELASGIYYLIIVTESGFRLSHKVVIL